MNYVGTWINDSSKEDHGEAEILRIVEVRGEMAIDAAGKPHPLTDFGTVYKSMQQSVPSPWANGDAKTAAPGQSNHVKPEVAISKEPVGEAGEKTATRTDAMNPKIDSPIAKPIEPQPTVVAAKVLTEDQQFIHSAIQVSKQKTEGLNKAEFPIEMLIDFDIDKIVLSSKAMGIDIKTIADSIAENMTITIEQVKKNLSKTLVKLIEEPEEKKSPK